MEYEATGSLREMPRVFAGVADDVNLHNPLERMNRLSCGWLGAIFEWEGVIVADQSALHRQAWLQLAEEEDKSAPLAFMLRRAEGMKNEQVLSEVFCWTRNPMEMRRLARRKEDIFLEMQGGEVCAESLAGLEVFLKNLKRNGVPCAIGCSASANIVETTLPKLNLDEYFEAIITADDVYRGRPDPEAYLFASQQIGRVPQRCVVIGNANSCIEAAHDAGMKCIAVGTKHPMYELSAADLVVRQLNELSLINVKQLFSIEDWEQAQLEPQLEMETEAVLPSTEVATLDQDFFY
ncbi:hypothetical protein CYMTET_48064 [Cymbomonas tetramitiformis]|uniref:Uncharacterized protein n=1 Tax=Cymbomonas tetramitiformis TaxID=36881 RepID=A0AAE0BSZ5_9CHLO|nr:hypothetical protein CYMTET_48064 [Cymbomonas tetramitiformis]